MINTKILQYLKIANAITPVTRDPYSLSQELEIEIIDTQSLHKDAYLICLNGHKLVFVSSNITSPHRKKFVISHEIGHYFLHQNQLYCCSNISEIGLVPDLKLNTSNQEQEANTFASEYLLPTHLLQEHLPNNELHFSTISSIAKEFDISVTLTAMKAVQNSKTESEILLCYNNNKLKWFVLPNNVDVIYKSSIPSLCPFDSLVYLQPEDITGYWDNLYVGSVHQEVFAPFGKQRLILLSGQRDFN